MKFLRSRMMGRIFIAIGLFFSVLGFGSFLGYFEYSANMLVGAAMCFVAGAILLKKER